MKKLFNLLPVVAVALAVGLVGCQKKEEAKPSPAQENSDAAKTTQMKEDLRKDSSIEEVRKSVDQAGKDTNQILKPAPAQEGVTTGSAKSGRR